MDVRIIKPFMSKNNAKIYSSISNNALFCSTDIL